MTKTQAKKTAQDIILNHGVWPATEFTGELLAEHLERAPSEEEYKLVREQVMTQVERVLKLFGLEAA